MRTIALALLICSFSFGRAQTAAADKILGLWLTGNGKAKIQISKYGDKYGGRIVWMREPNDAAGHPKLDDKNPDPAKRKHPKLGLNNLLGFTFDGNGEYEGGTVYDPENGKTYKCVMTLKDNNTLHVRGFIGFSLIGRTETWTRAKE